MNPKIQSLLDELREFEASAPGVGFQLRLSLSEILLKHLRLKGWTQSRLAKQAEMKEPQISRIIHSDANCTLDTIGKLFFALGVRVQFQEESASVLETDAVVSAIRCFETSPKINAWRTYGTDVDVETFHMIYQETGPKRELDKVSF